MKDNSANEPKPSRAVRLPRVCDLTGASPASVWRLVKNDPGFPKPFHLSAAITCWDEVEVLQWIDAKKAKRHSATSTGDDLAIQVQQWSDKHA